MESRWRTRRRHTISYSCQRKKIRNTRSHVFYLSQKYARKNSNFFWLAKRVLISIKFCTKMFVFNRERAYNCAFWGLHASHIHCDLQRLPRRHLTLRFRLQCYNHSLSKGSRDSELSLPPSLFVKMSTLLTQWEGF